MESHMCSFYSWGANSYGQLGNGNCEDLLAPEEFNFPNKQPNMKCILGGGGHSIFLADQRVYTCGWSNKGQLGLNSPDNRNVPHSLQIGGSTPVKELAAGWDFSLALKENGDVYSWGGNNFGQLGRVSDKNFDSTPTLILSGIRNIAAGLRHGVALCDNGEVLTWGSNTKGQLGRVSTHPTDSNRQNCTSNHIPQKVDFPQPTNVLNVAAGSYHSVCLASDGVLVFGANKYGQLGYDISSSGDVNEVSSTSPALLDWNCFQNERIVEIHSGWSHLVALSDTGKIFTWGRNDYFQLGRSSANILYDPKPDTICIPTSSRIKQICCGSEHNLILFENGDVFSWGWNEHGMCGSGDSNNIERPTQIKALSNISLIGSGAGHCFAYRTH